MLKEKLFVRAEKIDLKPKAEQAAIGSGEEGKSSTVRKRGGEQAASDSPKSKKQVCMCVTFADVIHPSKVYYYY